MSNTPLNDDWIDEILANHGASNYQAGKQYGYHSDNIRDTAKKEAKAKIRNQLQAQQVALLDRVLDRKQFAKTDDGYGHNIVEAVPVEAIKKLQQEIGGK